ncbi:uncharacterized protein LOC122094756 [Macadamia integrifolia]|uniref:uncharacterized protein LOC122094756 n=1 Tax=Macadamia integrifolia TaxID=60698 RepID=UPI001C52C96D|nr:uncharacterized protein LOC122094756 [Macadamia integrifolia]
MVNGATSALAAPDPMSHFHLRRLFHHREKGERKEEEGATASMLDPKQRKSPKLERRDALKNINYDPFSSSSYSSASSPSDSLRTRSLDVIPLETSFRIDSVECAERLYQSLGIFGPEDLGIPADAWEVSKSRHSSVVLPASRLQEIVSPTNREEAHETGVRVDHEAVVSVELAPSNESKNCYGLLDVRSSGVGGVDAVGGGGIKGARPPMLAPPPLQRPYVDDMGSASTWDIIGSFAPEEDRGSSSCPVMRLDSSSSDEEDGVSGEGEEVSGDVVVREEEEIEVRLGKTTVMPESPSFSTSNDEDCSSSTTETTYTISPSGSFRRSITSWQRGHVLGAGSFGTAYEAFTDDGFFFAVKEISLVDQSPQSIQQLVQEIAFLREFEHENIVQYLGTDRHVGKLCIFLELVTQGSLVKVYQKYHLGDSQVSAYTRQILSGLKYLHDREIIHRDIKCANILVHTSGSVKLADFGLAKATKLNDVKSCKGTAFWMAPEVVKRKPHGYGPPADIWSLGCTVLEMLTRKVPYSPLEWMQALFKIGKGIPPPVPDTLSRDAQDFIHQCLRVNPDDRPTAALLLNHPFLQRSLSASSVPGSPLHNSRWSWAQAVGRAHSPDVLTVLSADSSPCSSGSSFRELDDVFLQTQARIWLGEVLHTRLDEETAIADLLADGKLLFQVSRVIRKMLLKKCMELRYSKAYIYEPKISGKCGGRYMPYSNVDSFLKICQILGLTGIDLFSPSDVVEKRDIRRVCMCIRSLSKKARSKHLIVPDFDIVTYTIAMPTDMVGCIRRSLERSLHSASSSSGSNPSINSKVKYRQNEDYARSYDSFSEESDDAESDFRIFGFQSPDSNASNTTTLLFPDLEKSLGVSEVAENCFLTKTVLLLDTEDQEVDGHNSQYGPVSVMASMGSLNTNHQRNVNPELFSIHSDATLNHLCIEPPNDLNAGEFYINRKGVVHPMCTLENDSMSFCHVTTPASVVVASVETHTSEGSYAGWQSDISELNGHRTHSCDYVLSDGEAKGRIFLINNGSSSNHRTSNYVLGRRLYDEMEDAEMSSVASLNSVSSKMVTVDFEGFEVEHDFSNEKIDSPKFQNLDNDQMDVRSVSGLKFYDTAECQNPEDIVTPETDRPQGNMKCVNSMNSTYAFQPTADLKRFFTIWDQNHVGPHDYGIMYGRDSAFAQADNKVPYNFNATLYSENVLSNVNCNELDEVLSSQLDSPCCIQAIWNEKFHRSMTMLSKGKSVAAPSQLVMPHGLYPNFVRHSPTIATGGPLQLDNSNSLVGVNSNTDEICIASKSGADIDTRKHPSISLSTTCFSEETEVSSEAFSAGSTVGRNEMNLEVLGVQNCYKYLFVANNLNCSLKQMFRDGVGCKNTSEDKVVLNRFSTLTEGEEKGRTCPLSLETFCFPQVNPSGITIGEDSMLNYRNSIRTAILCRRSSLFDIIATPDLMIHQQYLDGNLDKRIQPVCGDGQTAESDSYRLKIEGMSSPLEVRDACSKFSDGTVIRNIGCQEGQTTIMVLMDKHVDTSDVPVNQSMLTLDNQPYSSVACFEETCKEENSENIVETLQQLVHGACINCDKEVAYCTKHTDEGKGKHEKVNKRTVNGPKVRKGKPGRSLLLRSIAGGITLFGGILLYLHFSYRRKGGREKLGETSIHSIQARDANSPELSTRKAQKRDGTNRVYPERLRFQG